MPRCTFIVDKNYTGIIYPEPTIDKMAVATAAAATAPLSQKTHDSVGVADLEKVTDYAPEKEISGDVGKVNSLIILNKPHPT